MNSEVDPDFRLTSCPWYDNTNILPLSPAKIKCKIRSLQNNFDVWHQYPSRTQGGFSIAADRIVDADLEELRGGGCIDIDQLGDVINRAIDLRPRLLDVRR